MKPSFSQYFRIAAVAIFLVMYAMSGFALVVGNDWQAVVDKHTLLMTQGQHEHALEVAHEALVLAETGRDKDQKKVALSLYMLGVTYGHLGLSDKALLHLERLLAISEKISGPHHPNNAVVLSEMVANYHQLTQYGKALPLMQRALAIREKSLGPEHPETAKSLNNLAKTYGELGQYEKTLPLLQRALAIAEQNLGPDHPDVAWIVGNIASNYEALAKFDKALMFGQRALAIREKTLGPDHLHTAESLINLASTYKEVAQYEKALPLEQRALAINERTLGTKHPHIAWSLNNLALTYEKLARYDKALELMKQSLAINEETLGPENSQTAHTLNNLASIYNSLAQYEQALPLQQRALEIFEKILGTDHPATASSLDNLGGTYHHLEQYEIGFSLQRRALVIREKTLGPEHPDTALSLHNLANHYLYMKENDKALPVLQRSLAIRERVLGADHPDTASSLGDMAFTLRGLGQIDLAIAFYKAAVNAYQNQREHVSRIDETALYSYTDSVAYTYQTLAALLVDQGLLSDAQLILDMLKENEQFEFVRRGSNADPRLTRIGYNSNEQLWMTRYRQIADRLAALGAEEQALQKQTKLGELRTEQKQRQQALASDLRVAQAAFDSFLKEMRENFGRQGPVKAAEAGETSQGALRELQDLIKGIGPDTVLLQYYVTEDKVGMLLTTPGVQLARSTVVRVSELNRRIAEFRRSLRNPKSDAMKESQALYQLLVAPVEQDLAQAGARTVMLSLDGTLRYLPFGALHDGQRYMVQRWNLPIYTSVTKNRLRDAGTAQWQAVGLGVTRALGEFTALPAVKNEMRSIFKSEGAGVLPGEVYLDEAFTAQRFKDVSQRAFQLLHVASHFQFSPGTEINSFLLLGDGQQLTLGDIRTQNYRFDSLDLLTLSACDTGLGGGRDAQGREIEGFGVIAQQQGAKAVLATLWPVADESTAKLMAEMYRRRQDQQQTKIESLRQAQLSLLGQSRYAHPFYWAPFILMGNWK